MPVPRRFDRRPPERDSTRINDRIRVPEVRLVGEDGKQIGVIKTTEALVYAQERDLDLVEVAADARPPVCRVLDYSKYKYEQEQKQKAARKHQQQINIREIKFRPKIAQNDYDTKKGHVRRFLKGKDKVKVTIMFRGREVTHPERGVALLNRLAEELVDVGTVEQSPLQDGRNMTMMLGPSKAVLAGELEGDAAATGAAEAASDAATAPSDAAEVKADAPDVKADPAKVKADAAEVKADAAEVKADAAEVKADPVKVKAAPAAETATGSNGHQNGEAAKTPSPAASDAPA